MIQKSKDLVKSKHAKQSLYLIKIKYKEQNI